MNAHELQSGRMSAMFLGTLAIMFGIADADVITVDDDDPSADFSSIQEAVDAAVSGDRIEVGPGVYVANWKGAQPVVSVSGKSLDIVAISNNPANTVISGENERRCVEWEFAFGGTLEGFTFDSGATNTNGGAVYLDYVGVTIEDCVFQNCSAGNSGGAIYSLSDTVFPPIARDCRFVSNDAVRNGGAIYALGGYDLYDCVFEENTAIDYGGGIYFDENPPMGAVLFSVITNCDFRDCAAMYGGGVYGVEATLWVTDSRFDDCIAGDSFAKTGWGGGIALGLGELQMSGGRFLRCEGGQSSGGLDADQSLAVCSGVSFTECTGWVTGGGVYAFGVASRLDLEDCSFDSNVAANDGGAAISCESSVASLDLLRCTFDDNLGLDDGFCILAPNIVTARYCDFNQQNDGAFGPSVGHVYLSGIGIGSRFTGCRFVDSELPDRASSFRAVNIGGLEFNDCVFSGNRTIQVGNGIDTEGAVYIAASPDDDSAISFTGCSFYNNDICCWLEQNDGGQGGALRVVGRRVSLDDCIFELNGAAIGGSLHAEAAISNCIIDGSSSVGTGGAAYLYGNSSIVNSRVSGGADCNYPAIHAGNAISIDGCTITGRFGLPFACLSEPIELAVCKLVKGSTVSNTRFCDYSEAAIFGAWTDLGGNSFNPDDCNAADINGDGVVNGADLALILASWGQPCLGCAADVNEDGEVNGADLALILAGWG